MATNEQALFNFALKLSGESIRVTFGHFREPRAGIIWVLAVITLAIVASPGRAQAPGQAQASTATAQGHVRDAGGKPVAGATVFLDRTPKGPTSAADGQTTHTDSEGAFHFSGLPKGDYTLRAEGKTGGRTILNRVTLARGGTETLDMVLRPAEPSATGSRSQMPGASPPSAKQLDFYDEPQFTVAGVTQATNFGGHGSDTVLRNSEALVRATGSLGKDAASTKSSTNEEKEPANLERERTEIRTLLLDDDKIRHDQQDKAHYDQLVQRQSELHHRLGQIDEQLGNPLEAVREYQRASELAASEPNLFDWASELLTHRALEPATEVFTKGTRLYPESVRMLIGLGVAWYARGSYDHAAQSLNRASDLAPRDPTPYLFMGKMQSVETMPSNDTLERLARFQRLEPNNALANYSYAAGLWKSKQSGNTFDDAGSAQVEALLQKAVQLDPKLGAAHLQLGVLYAQRGDYPRAITAYQKAIEVSPDLEETHYRLSQAYRRTGDQAKAKEQLRLHEQLSRQAKEEAERERREIQQFVVSLRDRNTQ